MSCGASALSKPMEAFMSSMISAGGAEKRPPHIVLEDRSVKGWGSELGVVDGSETSAKARSAPGARLPAAYVLVALCRVSPDLRRYTSRGAGSTTPTRRSPCARRPPRRPAARHSPALDREMTAFRFHPEPREIANVRFVDGSGAARSLSDWKGKVVLLNLWATWCAPCRKEMPALDRLQKALGSDVFEVVPLNLDRGGVETAKKFLDQIKNEALKLYADPSTRASTELNAVGMPTTILIDRDGRELGRIVGPAEWDGADAQRLIAACCASWRSRSPELPAREGVGGNVVPDDQRIASNVCEAQAAAPADHRDQGLERNRPVTACQAAKDGAQVVLVSRNEEALQQVVREITEQGGEAIHIVADVASREDLQRVADETVARFGRFDTWVNNAGVSIWGGSRRSATRTTGASSTPTSGARLRPADRRQVSQGERRRRDRQRRQRPRTWRCRCRACTPPPSTQ